MAKPESIELTQRLMGGADPDPDATYRMLRDFGPLVWDPNPGYWICGRHQEVHDVSVTHQVFSSAAGILPLEIGFVYETPPTMMHTDPPLHTQYRALLSPAFRPSRMKALTAELNSLARDMVAALDDSGPLDITAELCVPYPLYVIAALLGVPRENWEQFFEWSEATIPDATGLSFEERQAHIDAMRAYMLDVVRERRAEPRDDLISVLGAADIDGRALSDAELLMFLDQLLVAGNETTRNLLSGSVKAMAERPDQVEALRTDRSLMPTAVEEFLRFTTPVVGFMRTATQDTVLAGQEIAAGEAVHMVYASANRDERVFGDDADRLDIGRRFNPHLAFGFGAHFCIGAALARIEAAAVWNALLDRFGRFELVSAERSPSTIIGGWRSVVVTTDAA